MNAEKRKRATVSYVAFVTLAVVLGAGDIYIALAGESEMNTVAGLILGGILSVCTCYWMPHMAGWMFAEGKQRKTPIYLAGGIVLAGLSVSIMSLIIVVHLRTYQALPIVGESNLGDFLIKVALTLVMCACTLSVMLKSYTMKVAIEKTEVSINE
jgi:hypothetical protein